MRGEVLHFDDNTGTGQISGDDGNRYSFTHADLKRFIPVRAGTKVDFEVDGREAREIYVLAGSGVPTGLRAAAVPGPAVFGGAEPELSMFGYFKRAYTAYFANFRGRARRKEYWGFALYTWLFATVGSVVLVGVVAATASGRVRYEADDVPPVLWLLLIFVFLAVLFTVIPSIAITVRRFHDIGQSGWLVLLFYVLSGIPYVNFVSSIVWLVLLCIDTQPMDNKYGPPPKQFYAIG